MLNDSLVIYVNKSSVAEVMPEIKQYIIIVNGFWKKLNAFVSRPRLHISAKETYIEVGYYMPYQKAIPAVSMLNLREALNYHFNTDVNLKMTRLTRAYLDTQTLATSFAKILFKKKKFIRSTNIMFNASRVARINARLTRSNLLGIKMKLNGRLATEKSRPRITVQNLTVGGLTNTKKATTNAASCSIKNHKGIYNVKVWINTSRLGTNNLISPLLNNILD